MSVINGFVMFMEGWLVIDGKKDWGFILFENNDFFCLGVIGVGFFLNLNIFVC